MGHTTHMNMQMCHAYGLSQVMQTNKPCHAHEYVMSHTSMISDATHMNESCHTMEKKICMRECVRIDEGTREVSARERECL